MTIEHIFLLAFNHFPLFYCKPLNRVINRQTQKFTAVIQERLRVPECKGNDGAGLFLTDSDGHPFMFIH